MWVYAHNGQKVGPITFEEIVNQIHSGVIVPNTPVCSSGEKPCRAGHHPKLQPIFASMNKTSANALSGSQEVSIPNATAGSENQSSAFPQFQLTESSSKHTSYKYKKTRHRTTKKGKMKNQDQFKLIIIVGIIVFCSLILGVFLLSNLQSSSTTESDSEASSSESSSPRKNSRNHSDIEATKDPLSQKGNASGERKVITVKGVDFAFRWCPSGAFLMGNPRFESQYVTLTKGFWMMETEVTQKQWVMVMGSNPSNFKGNDLPVEMVSWDDCQEFCKKCSALKLPIKLPTEAQWEYACRAGTTTDFSWGNEYRADKANCNGLLETENGKCAGKTTRVGSYPANAWGFYDMVGNVWEWCQDKNGSYHGGRVTDPINESDFYEDRVIRGSCWDEYMDSGYSWRRNGTDPEYSSNTIGFRCVLVP